MIAEVTRNDGDNSRGFGHFANNLVHLVREENVAGGINGYALRLVDRRSNGRYVVVSSKNSLFAGDRMNCAIGAEDLADDVVVHRARRDGVSMRVVVVANFGVIDVVRSD